MVAVTGINLSACSRGAEETVTPPESALPTQTNAEPAPPPTPEELANATYSGIHEEPVTLTDGQWEGEPFVEGGASRPTVGLVADLLLSGDLDGDGSPEAVVLLWTSSGGSGTFDYLAAMGRRGGQIVNLATAEIGDRVKIREARLAEDRIVLEVVQAGPEDAACCPSEKATRTWILQTDGLVEQEAKITGTLSLVDLMGPEWVLTHFSWDEPAPQEPEVTLVFEEDRIAGKSACNNYFGAVEEGGDIPGSITIGQVGATRMMCPEEVMMIEDRFQRQLSSATQYGFLTGKLALTWQDDGTAGVMLFKPREPSS
jgi:heat shock protein HslJ